MAEVVAGMNEVEQVRADVEQLATVIGPRHPGLPAALERARDHISSRLSACGLEVRIEAFSGMANVIATVPGRGPGTLLIGAHYDSVPDVVGAPGADDNASGVAALLALAARVTREPLSCSVRIVAFANEEGMRWGRERGGSWHHAGHAPRPDAALILDALGWCDLRPGSQAWPAWWMPWVHGTRGDFLCVQAAWRDRALARRCASAARRAQMPVRGCWWPGQTWQMMGDQESFHHHGVPVITLTDTDRFRNPRFHKPSDRSDTLDYGFLVRAVEAAWLMLPELARRPGGPTAG